MKTKLYFLIPFLFFCTFSHAKDWKAASDILENYQDNTNPNKRAFIRDIEATGITGNGYRDFEVSTSDSTTFYRFLAALDYEEDRWYAEMTSIDFLHMGLRLAKTEEDSLGCYKSLVLAYFVEIANEVDTKQQRKLKNKLDEIAKEIENIESDSSSILETKHILKHNMGVVLRYLRDFDEARRILESISSMDRVAFTSSEERKVDIVSNSINELGRVYLSWGILENNKEYLKIALSKFDEAIDLLHDENGTLICSPRHLKELYQRKLHVTARLTRNKTKVLDLEEKVRKFTYEDCFSEKDKAIYGYMFRSIAKDFRDYEVIEDVTLSAEQNDERTDMDNWLGAAFIFLVGLLFISSSLMIRSRRGENELQKIVSFLEVLQSNSSNLLKSTEIVKEGEGIKEYLDSYLPEQFSFFQKHLEESSATTIILFNRDDNTVVAKMVYVEDGALVDLSAKVEKVDEQSIYYPYFIGEKIDDYVEGEFLRNFKNHNSSIDKDYLTKKEVDTESLICVPLLYGKNKLPLGIITLQSSRKNFFKKEHVNLIKSLSNNMTIVASNFEIIQQKHRLLRVIDHRIGNYIDMNVRSLGNIKRNMEKWDENTLKTKLIEFGGDSQILKKTLTGLLYWVEILGLQDRGDSKIEEFILKEAIKDEIEQLHFPITEQGVNIDLSNLKASLMVDFPKIYIGEIISNLLINSIQHFASIRIDNPSISISSRINDDSLVIDFWDNGLGMPDSVKKDMFSKSISSEYQAKSMGGGFGSMIIRYLVTKLGGDARVVHSNKTDGTLIEILIPRKFISND